MEEGFDTADPFLLDAVPFTIESELEAEDELLCQLEIGVVPSRRIIAIADTRGFDFGSLLSSGSSSAESAVTSGELSGAVVACDRPVNT